VQNEQPVGFGRSFEAEQNWFDEYFRKNAHYWKRIYEEERDVYALIHQQRMARVKELVDQLHLPPNTRILEVGCGTGLTTIAMAERGYRVEAMDSVPAMIELTRQLAAEARVSERVTERVGDCHRLVYPSNSFQVLIAMGVTPFLHSLPMAMSEFARVLTPGGHLIVNADNRWRLNKLMDPLLTPLLSPFRGLVKAVRQFLAGRASPSSNYSTHMYSPREFDAILAGAGLRVVSSSMLGFGPFSFCGLGLPNFLGLPLHRTLQTLADFRLPVLRSAGSQYIVLATKPEVGPTKVN
jgi:ubiquinone/menaquinone biosynthesis C-methylase UbiE